MTMLGGQGFYRGSSVLISGTAGTRQDQPGRPFRAMQPARRGERCLYFAFEESRDQIVRNMRSIGLDLEPRCNAGCCTSKPRGPREFGLEMHLVRIHKLVADLQARSRDRRSHHQPHDGGSHTAKCRLCSCG